VNSLFCVGNKKLFFFFGCDWYFPVMIWDNQAGLKLFNVSCVQIQTISIPKIPTFLQYSNRMQQQRREQSRLSPFPYLSVKRRCDIKRDAG